MEDLTTQLQDVTNEYKTYYCYKNKPITEEEWDNVKCILYLDEQGYFRFVGHIRLMENPVYVIKASVEECKDVLSEIIDIVNKYIERRELHSTNGLGASRTYHKETYGLVHNDLITLEEFNKFPTEYYRIKMALENAKNSAELMTDIIDWKKFSGKMDVIDQKANEIVYGYDCYPSLREFNHLIHTNYTFMMLSKDEYAKSQYKRLINHLRKDFDATMRLR